MILVKPPTFEELAKTYGSPKATIQHLLKAGFSHEQITWKIGIPYHLIRLFIEDVQSTNPVLFSNVVKTYERVALLRSKKGKETELAKFARANQNLMRRSKVEGFQEDKSTLG